MTFFESPSRFSLLFEHDLVRKPASTFGIMLYNNALNCWTRSRNDLLINGLTYFAQIGPGLFPGLCDLLECGRHFGIKDVGISDRCRDVRVIEQLLHEFQIASLAQNLSREIVSEVVKPKSGHLRFSANLCPFKVHIVDGEGISLAADLAASICAAGDEGEYVVWVVTSQGPEDFPNRRRDWNGDPLVALALLSDLARVPVNFRPLQQAL